MPRKNGKSAHKNHQYHDPLHEASRWTLDPRQALRVDRSFVLASFDPAATPGWKGDETDAAAYVEAVTPLLASLQERLFAASKEGSPKRILVVAQGLDTAGKGGLARHVMGLVDPQGVHLKAFKAPTEEELAHDFLWRIRRAVPGAGMIGFFDRSHYEDILVPGAGGELDDAAFTERVEQIQAFEEELIAAGTTIVKVALMISHEQQGLRLLERIDRPDKHWKYSPADLATRARWFDYQAVYQRMLPVTSFATAPWYAVPADSKWYARLAVTELLLHALMDQDVSWPPAGFDIDTERERVRATLSPKSLAHYDARREMRLKRANHKEAVVEAAVVKARSGENV